ncbi:hypothetical protein [Rubrivirga sp. IMCC45206]|uniref:hypothetical protein n=1 Tax=Rubrivirga sp. IMCC45206 TaxID=3391614 RepID=UPI00398FA631
MRLLLAAFVLLPLAASAQTVDAVPVIFLPGGAGAEGCYAQWSTRSAVRAYSAPTRASEHIRTVDGQRRIDANDYSESLTAVLQTGMLRALRITEAEGTPLNGSGDYREVRLGAGDSIEILANGPEESVFFLWEGIAYAGFVPGFYGGDRYEVVRRPVTELWVRLREAGEGRPASWVNTAQAGMAPREAFCE